MQIDPDEGSGMDDYVIVEDGTYALRIESIQERSNADGERSWMLRLGLVEGERAGRTASIDWLNFTPRGMHRVRSILSALGFDVSVPVEVEPADLEGKVAHVRLITQESTHHETGRPQRRSRVPYDGWSPCPDAEQYARFAPPSGGAGAGVAGAGMAADAMPF